MIKEEFAIGISDLCGEHTASFEKPKAPDLKASRLLIAPANG